MKLHIAVLDEELPYPLTSGKRIRTLNLLTRLAQRHRLTYLCHRNADPAEAERAIDHFHSLGIAVRMVERAVPAKTGAAFYARLAGNLLSPLPYSVATHASEELHLEARSLAANDPPDLWHIEWTPYARLLDGLPGPSLVMAHNVESHIWRRYADTEESAAKRWYIRRQYRKFQRFERWACGRADCVVAVSEPDAAAFRDRFFARDVRVIDNGADLAYFAPPTPPPPRDPKRLLFLGSLDWRPNLDAVKLLLEEVFPKVRAADPEATLAVVGRQPPDWLREQVARSPGVELFADVPDVRPYLHGSGMLAVPLRVGGGSRLKILEALAAGLPVVSTRVGAEGLQLDPVRHLIVTDTLEQLTNALLGALRRPEAVQRQAQAARDEALARYDWGRLADKLDDVWHDLAAVPARVRRGA